VRFGNTAKVFSAQKALDHYDLARHDCVDFEHPLERVKLV